MTPRTRRSPTGRTSSPRRAEPSSTVADGPLGRRMGAESGTPDRGIPAGAVGRAGELRTTPPGSGHLRRFAPSLLRHGPLTTAPGTASAIACDADPLRLPVVFGIELSTGRTCADLARLILVVDDESSPAGTPLTSGASGRARIARSTSGAIPGRGCGRSSPAAAPSRRSRPVTEVQPVARAAWAGRRRAAKHRVGCVRRNGGQPAPPPAPQRRGAPAYCADDKSVPAQSPSMTAPTMDSSRQRGAAR
jgi:hypothetical protein